MFQRLRRLQQGEGLKWRQIADRLGVTVGMLMMVKRKRRNLSQRVLNRLEQIEREFAEQRSFSERIADGLLAGEGTASELVEREMKDATVTRRHVGYRSPQKGRLLPKNVRLLKPTEEQCKRLRRLFAETMDVAVILLACLPEELRSEKYVARLTPDARIRLNRAALTLVIPNWRTLAAGDEKLPS